MNKPKILFRFLFLFFSSLALYAEQENKDSLSEYLAEPKLSFESAYMQRADIKDGGGSVQVTKNRLQINSSNLGFGYSNWKFDWNNIDRLPFGDGVHQPIEEMHSLNLTLSKSYRIDEKWFTLTSLSLNSTFEDSPKDSYGVGIFSFASYAIESDHTIQMGLFGGYHPVRLLIFPMLSYSYRTNQKDGIQAVIGFPNTYIGYHINSDTLIRLGALFSNSLIRLSNDSPIEQEGFAEFQDYMGSLGVTYEFNNKVKFMGDLLYALKRDLTIYNKDATELESYEIEPSAGVMFKIILKF